MKPVNPEEITIKLKDVDNDNEHPKSKEKHKHSASKKLFDALDLDTAEDIKSNS